MQAIRGNWQPRAEQILRNLTKVYAITPASTNLAELVKANPEPTPVWREYYSLAKEIENIAVSAEVDIAMGKSVKEIVEHLCPLLARMVALFKVAIYLKKQYDDSIKAQLASQ